MPNDEAGLGLLGALLGIPYNLPRQRQQAEQQQVLNQALMQALNPQPNQTPVDVSKVLNQPPAQTMGHGIPVVGPVVGAIGGLGHVLQSITGTAPAAPRVPPELFQAFSIKNAQEQRQYSREHQAKVDERTLQFHQEHEQDVGEARKFREQQAGVNTEMRRESLGLRRDLLEQGKIPRSLENELLNEGRAKGLSGKDLADFVRQGKGGSEGTPSFEKDIHAKAMRMFPDDPDKQFDYMESERIRMGGARTAATTGARLDEQRRHVSFTPTLQSKLMEQGVDPATATVEDVMKAHAEARIQRSEDKRRDMEMKNQLRPLQAATLKEIDIIDESLPLAKQIEELAKDPEVQQYMGPGMGRIAKGLYSHAGGYGVPTKVTQYIQHVAFLKSLAVGALLHGSRNPAIWKQIQEHLPDFTDIPRLQVDKTTGVTGMYGQNRQILLRNSALTVGGDEGAGAGGATTTAAPQPATPTEGVTPGGNTFKVIQ